MNELPNHLIVLDDRWIGLRRRRRAGQAAEPAGKLGLTGWVLFDWATQPYYTLVVTFLFAPYFVNGFVGDPALGSTLWAYAIGIAELIAALLAPVLGAIADAGLSAEAMDRRILGAAGRRAYAGCGSRSPGAPAWLPLVLMLSPWPPSGLSSPPSSTTP